jgi:hypothetical protein
MIPPGFARFWEGKGLHRPYCFECVRFALEKGTSRGLCWEYGAYVSLYSSCESFERRVGSSTPIVDADAIRACHRFGMEDLMK